MEEGKKKALMIGIIVVCIVAAVAITIKTRTGGSGTASIKHGELMWVKCSNPGCGAEYQIDKKDYFDFLDRHMDDDIDTEPPMTCKECGKESIYRAVKCEKCGLIFFSGAAGPGDFADRCPECSYSKEETKRKEAAARRRAR